jgi:hypothetical protein
MFIFLDESGDLVNGSPFTAKTSIVSARPAEFETLLFAEKG